MRALAVRRDHLGTYSAIPGAAPRDFAGILVVSSMVERVGPVPEQWWPYTAAWRVTWACSPSVDPGAWYLVDEEDPPLGVDAVAELCDVRRRTIHVRRHRGTMIEPAGWVSDSPWWHRADVLWAEQNGRLHETASQNDTGRNSP